jgi:hypothetical protein
MDKTTLQQMGALEAASGMVISLIVIVVLSLAFIWNIQRDRENQVDIKDLICSDGRINEAKFMRFTAFVVSTWGFVYLIVDQRFSEWYFAGYMAAWAGNALLNKWLTIKQGTSNGSPPPPPPRPNI